MTLGLNYKLRHIKIPFPRQEILFANFRLQCPIDFIEKEIEFSSEIMIQMTMAALFHEIILS